MFVGHLALAFAGKTVSRDVMWASGPYSPPPPSAHPLAIFGLIGGWTIVPWTWWIERTSARWQLPFHAKAKSAL